MGRAAALLLASLAIASPLALRAEGAPTQGSDAEGADARWASADQLFRQLRERIRVVEERERELDLRERSIAELEAEATRALEEAEAIRAAVEARIARIEAESGSEVGRLAKVYGAMPADRAAPLLAGLDLDLATKILTKMKHKKSALVLARMSEEVALRLSRNAARPLANALVADGPKTVAGGTQ